MLHCMHDCMIASFLLIMTEETPQKVKTDRIQLWNTSGNDNLYRSQDAKYWTVKRTCEQVLQVCRPQNAHTLCVNPDLTQLMSDACVKWKQSTRYTRQMERILALKRFPK